MLLEALRPLPSRPLHCEITDQFNHASIAKSHRRLCIIKERGVDCDCPAFFGDVGVGGGKVELAELFGKAVAVTTLEGGLEGGDQKTWGFGGGIALVFALHFYGLVLAKTFYKLNG